jgi:hypothetical protein
LVLLVEVLKEKRRGLEEEFRKEKESYKIVRYQLLVLIEVLIKVLIKILIEIVLVKGRSSWY